MSAENLALDEALLQDDRLSRGLAISVGVHVGIFALFFLKSIFFEPKPYDIPASMRVDIVALPDKIQELPAAPAAPAPAPPKTESPKEKEAKPEPAKPKKVLPKKSDDAINLEKKQSEKSALEKLKAMEAMEKLKADIAAEKAAEHAAAEKARLDALAKASRAKVKGNQLSPGASLNGLDKLQYDEYGGMLDRHIKPHWQIADWLMRKGYRAQALVRVDAQGNLISKQMLRSSGNPDFDQAALDTIDRSVPLPPPPEKFVAIVSQQGIVVDFGDEKGSPQ